MTMMTTDATAHGDGMADPEEFGVCLECNVASAWGSMFGNLCQDCSDEGAGELLCHECGGLFDEDEGGVTNHVDGDGGTDFDLDLDHVPFML